MSAEKICDLDLVGVSAAIAAREVSSVEATEAYLERIQRYDGVLQSYITVMADRARAAALTADDELRRGQRRGPLHGVPLALKDLIACAGVRMTAGSRLLADHVPAADATVTRRLQAAGAVILGKLSMHEFAFGRPATDEPFPTGHNPWDIERAPAGSSSGSGVAVAAGLCAGALGSDTGGSIRGPAAMCGIVGLKPTDGRRAWDLLAAPSTDLVPDRAAGHALADVLADAGLAADPTLDVIPRLAGLCQPVTLMHGRRDTIVPFTETLRLADRLPRTVPRDVMITTLFGHTKTSEAGPLRSPLGLARDAARFVATVRRFLRAVE